MIDLAVNLAGTAVVAFVVWWFWLGKPKAAASASPELVIEVADGVYQPSRVQVPAGQPATLKFLRRDPSPCAEKVIFHDLGVSAELPLHRQIAITLPPPAPGEHVFTCDMGMYRGSIVAI